MGRLFAGVKALTGDEPVSKGWKYLAVKKAQWLPIKSGENRGQPRLALQITVVEPESEEGGIIFDGGVFSTDKSTGRLLGRLQVISPNEDWDNFEFPDGFDDAEGIERLSDALVGCEFYGLIRHTPRYDDREALQAVISRVARQDANIDVTEPEED